MYLRALNIRRFASHEVVNYLYPGDTLNEWSPQRDADVTMTQPARRPEDFEQALSDSVEWRHQFQRLGCRGFSYQLDPRMETYDFQRPRAGRLRHEIDLRLALMPGRHLFYPATVRHYFASQ